MNTKQQKRQRRKMHIKSTVRGTAERPRLVVFRSNNHIYAQVINDTDQVTLASAGDMKAGKGTPTERAHQVGLEIAGAAKKANVNKVVFDRGGYKFHGRVKSLAEAAREGGLDF